MAADEVQPSNKDASEQSKQVSPDVDAVKSNESSSNENMYGGYEEPKKKTFWELAKEPGSAIQIVAAALVAVAIALPVAFEVDADSKALADASTILNIPGRLWLRALTAVGKF